MTAEELLKQMSVEPYAEEMVCCVIDPETRVIDVPAEYQLLGVESDEKVERMYFQCPKIVGDNIDLSKLALRVNFRNANDQKDQYIVDDVEISGDNITFSWLLSRRVTQYKGNVSFIVCAVKASGEEITNEWNTTLATAQVLEGLEADITLPEEDTDVVKQLIAVATQKITDVQNATSSANTAASNADIKAQEAANAAEDARGVIDQITKDSYLHTTTQTFVDTVKASPTAYGNAIPEQIEGDIGQDTTKGLNIMPDNYSLLSNTTCKISDNGKLFLVTSVGTNGASAFARFNLPFTLEKLKGKTLYASDFTTEKTGNGTPRVIIFKESGGNGSLSSVGTIGSGGSLKIPDTFEENADHLSVYLYANNQPNTSASDSVTYKNLWLSLDSPLETWEPYTGGEPSPNPDYPQIVHGIGDMGFFDGELLLGAWNDSNGMFSPNNDVYVSGKNIIPCKPNDQIVIEYGVQFRATWIIWVKKDGSFISSQLFQNVKRCTAVAPTTCYGFKFSISEKASVANVEATKSILVLINDKYAVCVKSKGKNVLDFEGFLNSRGSLYTKCGDQYRITGTGSAYSNPILLSDEDEDFTLTGSVTSESGKGYSVQLLNNAGDIVAFIRDDTKKASGKGCKIRLNYVDAGTGVYEDIMVEKGTSHDKYIPYQSTTTYIPVDYPLFEGDKIVRRNGEYKLLRKWGFKTYDGSDDEDWKINYIAGSEAQNAVYNVYIGDMANDAKKERYVPCNYFWSPAMGYYLNTTYVSVTGNYNIIISPDMKIDTDQKWKDWLKTHIMYCAYELATPTEEPLSSEAMKALYSIMACDEETELTIVGVPSDAEIQNQFLLPRNEDGALNTTAYCTAKRNEIALEELVAQSLDARVNKLEVDNESLNLQTLIVE